MLNKASWETKSSSFAEKKQTQRNYETFQEQRKQFLNIRRKKLSDLLDYEEEVYRREIVAKQETPEQVRQKMEARLLELKTQREKERLETVKTLQERRFYESADELRKNDSEARAIACYLEQENQMLDKLKKRELEKREEEVYVQLNHYDNLKKCNYNINLDEKERQALEEKKKLKDETYKILDWQKQQQDLVSQREMELRNLEVHRLKEQWDKDLNQEKQEKEKVLEINKLVYRDIEEFNKKEDAERQMKTFIEKQKDKELVNNIVDKERALDDIDRKEKVTYY
jgi:hypothetical protein